MIGSATTVTLPTNNQNTFVINGGFVFGNDYRADFSTLPWGYKDGKKLFLPLGSADSGNVSYASPQGFAAGGTFDTVTGDTRAVRWSLANTPQPQLISPSGLIGIPVGMNLKGDVAVENDVPGSLSSTVGVVPVHGATIPLPGASTGSGLTAQDQSIVFAAGGRYLEGPSGRAKLPRDADSTDSCFIPVTDAGYLAYVHTTDGSDPTPYVYLRDPAGVVRRTGLASSDCGGPTLSDHGYLVGDLGEYEPGLYHAGTLTKLGSPPGATYPEPVAVNDEGDVVVEYIQADGYPGLALWRHGTWILLPVPEGDTVASNVTSLDDTGQATGWYENSQGEAHAVLWKFPAATT